jgi:hypothetical protein
MASASWCRLAPAALALVVLAGCFETELELGPRDQAKVDPRFVGDWLFAEKDSTTRMAVRNFNGREYYIAWDENTSQPKRAAAFVADVGGVSFAHVRDLPTDGTVPTKHSLLRVALAPDGRLTLRHVNHKFFEGKEVATSEQLRKLVEGNLENNALYDEVTFYGTRAAQ